MSDPVITLFREHSVPLDRTDVWAVQGVTVVKHRALERLGAALRIVFDPPTVLRAERDECVMIVVGRIGDRHEWSTGEALVVGEGVGGNYKVTGKQASYVYAMAEKRGKDRVIIKLAGLHGAYSEEEADDLKRENAEQPRPEPRVTSGRQPEAEPDRAAGNRAAYVSVARAEVTIAETPDEVDHWWREHAAKRHEHGIVKGTPEYDVLAKAAGEHKAKLGRAA